MSSNKLFDQKFINKGNQKNKPLSNFEVLATRKDLDFESIRIMLNDWFSHFPADGKKDLKGRFQSSNNIDHQGAFFELIIHELHFQLNCEITLHRETTSDKESLPDFYISDLNNNTSYVETTVVAGKSNKRMAAESRLSELIRHINRAVTSSKFWLSLVQKGYPDKPVSSKEISNSLNKELDSLDYKSIKRLYSEHGFDQLPKWNYEAHGCSLTFSPIPKSTDLSRKPSSKLIKIQTGEFEFVDDRSPINKSIAQKANKYGKLKHPLVIAINCLKSIDEIDVMEALFGQEQFIIPIGSPNQEDIIFSRKPDGVLIDSSGPRYTRISGILVTSNLRPWSISASNICLYLNPWAEFPYSSVLRKLDYSSLQNNKMKKCDGEHLSDILDIDSYF